MKADLQQILKTMRSFKNECTDKTTGEINYTLLTEKTCHELNLYVGDDIPEELFDIALWIK